MSLNKLFLRCIAVFGMLMVFAISGWAACLGNYRGAWTSGTTYSRTFTQDYYTLTIGSSGTLNLNIKNTSSGSGTRNIIYTLYQSNACNAPVITGSTTLTEGSSSTPSVNLSAGTYTLQIVRTTSSTSSYSWNGVFVASVPEINVVGVSDGGTDTTFGTTGIASGTIDKTYTIENTGTASLSITGVTFSGGNSGDFSVVTPAPSSIAASSTGTFTVQFNPSAVGNRSTTLNITNDDSNENPYNFSISGIGVDVPALTDTTRSIDENSVGGTNVGAPLSATNSPTGYSITGGTGATLFDISASGQITVIAGAILDYETTPTYSLLVKPSNEAGDGNEANITINLTDVLVPVITPGQSYTLKTGTLNGTVVGTVATTVTTPSDFNITGSVFAISDTGVITVADSSGLVAGTATYTVGASTSEGGDTKPITIVVTQRVSDLELANTDSKDPVITDEIYSYTVGVYNAGPDEATDVVLVDTLPAGVEFVSAVGTGWACNEYGGYVTCTRPSLNTAPVNSNVIITVKAPAIGGVITNSATVTSSGLDPVPFTNTDVTQDTTVTAIADLRIVKTGPATATTNNTAQYTLTVNNLGPSGVSDINVTDVLPTGLEYQVYSGNDWVCSYTSATKKFACTHPTTLASGDSSQIILVTTTAATAQNITNTATVTSSVSDPVSSNNTSSASTNIQAASYTSANVRPFALYRQDNINGDIQMIGNSVMETSTGSCAPATTNNNNLNTRYADKDTNKGSNPPTLNSTSADLKLPAKVRSSDILYAILYWQGRTTGTSQIVNGRTVKIKPFGLTGYQTVTTLDTKFNWTDNDYQGAQDVTQLIKNSMDYVGDATLDSTGYNKPLWVGDVFANQLGNNSNGYGAWSLIIAYKDADAKLRNISTYDGFVAVYQNTKQATLSGFLTPSSGPVDSKFLVFAGEGDVSLADSVTLTDKDGNDQSLGSNVFKSIEDINGVNVTTRNPNCANTIGADIRTFSIGTNGSPAIIGNGQTTTTVKLTSPNNNADKYMPGAFAFSTELYVPEVCYDESVSFNGLPITGENIPSTGDKVEYLVTIKNLDPEDADGVFVEKVFYNPNQIKYSTSSMQVAPIPGTTFTPKTDKVGDDTAEYSSGTATAKFLLGAGAQWYQGGKITQGEETKFKYKAKVGDQNVSDSGYKISYRNDLLHLTFNGISAPKCTDFNNSFYIIVKIPVISGGMTVIESSSYNEAGNYDYADKNLFTKVVQKPFDLEAVYLDDDGGDETIYDGTIGNKTVNMAVMLYTSSSDENCTEQYELLWDGELIHGTSHVSATALKLTKAFQDRKIRANFIDYGTLINNTSDLTCAASSLDSSLCLVPACMNSDDQILKAFPVAKYPYVTTCLNGDGTGNAAPCDSNAYYGSCGGKKSASIIGPTKYNNDIGCVMCLADALGMKGCSTDNFAAKPERLSVNSTHAHMPNLLRSAQDYNVSINAYDFNSTTNTLDYNVTDANFSIVTKMYDRNNIERNSTTTPPMHGTSSLGTSSFNMSNGISVKAGVGVNEVVGLTFDDVGKININIQDQNWSEVDNDDTPMTCDQNGTYICGDKNVTFIPDHFDFNVSSITNNNGNPGSFTYIANELDQMAGRLDTTMRSLNADGNVTLNFAASPLWENNVTVTPVIKSTFAYTGSSAVLHDANVTSINDQPIGFVNGVKTIAWNENNASLYLRFNFQRDVNRTVEPFDVNGSDLNITLTSHYIDPEDSDTADIYGDRNASSNGSADFVYGRIIPRDVRVFGSVPFTANAWYEVWNTSIINGTPSRNTPQWFINTIHNKASDGNGSVSILEVSSSGSSVTIPSVYGNGVETYNFSAQTPPYSAKAHINTEPWLWYGVNASPYVDPSNINLNCLTHPCFNITVVPAVGRAGSSTKDELKTDKANKSTTVPTGVTYDYSPTLQ